jgi:cell division inhibitor SepF
LASWARKTMVYLGLVDDDYEEYETYEEPAPAQPMVSPPSTPPNARSTPRVYASGPGGEGGSIRTLHGSEDPMTVNPQPRPAVVRPLAVSQSAKVHVVAPGQFSDATEIGDRMKASQPVIVNLQAADRDLARRMIDFCSGATYALGGSMDKVADQVFLLTPSNVEVSAEEKRRLQERGPYRA